MNCLVLLLFLGAFETLAQDKTAEEYQVKAVFLYNFTQFVDWPSSVFASADAPFVIGIIGDDPFGSYLDDAVAGEKIGTHPIKVKRFNDMRKIAGCQMLFINSSDEDWVASILSAVAGKNILTVGDAPSFNKWGGIIRFYNEQNKIRLQINVAGSKAAQLSISSKLLSVAKTN